MDYNMILNDNEIVRTMFCYRLQNVQEKTTKALSYMYLFMMVVRIRVTMVMVVIDVA